MPQSARVTVVELNMGKLMNLCIYVCFPVGGDIPLKIGKTHLDSAPQHSEAPLLAMRLHTDIDGLACPRPLVDLYLGIMMESGQQS
ncbi:hypothetical protein VP1G_11082 [Cytospora mali]|uniref:Uncharacterized protein n=1 Tax=Cytospora mali TaxID=578113 RepID=A0A194V444_CYTMA|nr:hypothetical protein VP1G_11082 [Valsa mali var. pyri (nom. inval.)]